MSSKAKDQARKDALIAQFRQITGASQSDAVKYLKKYGYKVDAALDGLYNDPQALAAISSANTRESAGPSSKKLNDLFDAYKDEDGEDITSDNAQRFCQDIALDETSIDFITLSFELKSPTLGTFTRQGWMDGWKSSLKADSLTSMKASVVQMRDRLRNDSTFFRQVYMYAFDFTRQPGQRSLPVDNAKAFWPLLIGPALQVEPSELGASGWNDQLSDWWLEFLDSRGVKGISKDVWSMFLDFIRSIDTQFEKYDENAAWPSLVDDFVEFGRERVSSSMNA